MQYSSEISKYREKPSFVSCCTVRDSWHQEDPQFIAEVLFAVTSMLSFTRLAYILPAHESLGTLQISIGKMIDDMMRYLRDFIKDVSIVISLLIDPALLESLKTFSRFHSTY